MDAQMQDVLTRLLALEQRERKNADEILNLVKESSNLKVGRHGNSFEESSEKFFTLTRDLESQRVQIECIQKENKSLKNKVESSGRNFEELSEKFVTLRRDFEKQRAQIECIQKENKSLKNKLKEKNQRLEEIVGNLQTLTTNQNTVQEQLSELNRIKLVLNRALIRSYQKEQPEAPAEKGDGGNSSNVTSVGDLRKSVGDLRKSLNGVLSWIAERSKKDAQLLERVRVLDKRLGVMQAIEEQVEILYKWQENKASDYNRNVIDVENLRKSVDGLVSWKKEKSQADAQLLERIQVLDTRVDALQAIEEQVEIPSTQKEKSNAANFLYFVKKSRSK